MDDVSGDVGLIREQFAELQAELSDDLNSRTSNSLLQKNTVLDSPRKSSPTNVDRCSKVGVLNDYGKSLLNLCTALNFCVLNGMCHGDYSHIFQTLEAV